MLDKRVLNKIVLVNLLIVLLLKSLPALSAPLIYRDQQAAEQLKQTFSMLESVEASFTQRVLQQPKVSVVDKTTEPVVLQEVQGRMALKRPNHLFWESDDPYPQTIVTEGEQIFLFDRDLDQVTVKKLDKALSNTPALLISGDLDAVEQQFDILMERSGQQVRFILTPKGSDAVFTRIAITFVKKVLSAMTLDDPLAQRTEITFSDVKQNRALPASLFQFTLPPGVDVINDF